MKITKKVAILSTAAVLMVSALAGCAANGGNNAQVSQGVTASSSTLANSTLERVLKTHQLTVGVILSFPPFGFKDTQGTPQGYDVDMAQALADSLHAKLNIVNVTAAARIPDLQTGKVDVVIGNFTRTLERAQAIDFTDPYVVAGERLIVRKGSGITGLKQLAGKTIGVTQGSTDATIVKTLEPTANIHYFTTSADAILALKNAQVDAYVEDSNFLQYQAKLNPTLEVTGDSVVPLEYNAFGLKKGDQEWMNYLNQYIFDMNSSGKNSDLYKKWFGVTPPFPLNPTLY